MPFVFPLTLLILGVFVLANSLRVLREYERGVIFRLGRYVGNRGPGLIFLVPFIERMVKVSLRTVAMDVEPQDVITKDNVSVRVNAVLYFRVIDPEKAIIEVEDFLFATSQIARSRRPPCAASSARRNWTSCSPSATSSTPRSRPSSTRPPTPGASRSAWWK